MVFVDYLILVHLMQSQSAEEAVIAKQSFEDCRFTWSGSQALSRRQWNFTSMEG
jgi:hypothetical protein